MPYVFFFGSIAAAWILLIIGVYRRGLRFANVLISLLGAGYSLFFDVFFGEYLGLYHYINPEISLLYMILSAAFLYPVVEIVYTIFMPAKLKPALIYTAAWIALMLAFEEASLFANTIVFTGWRMFPWSIAVYAATLVWISVLFRYMERRGL